MRDFLAHPVADIIPADDEVARAYGRIVAELRRAGTPLPANDVRIAAYGVRTSSVVLTHDDSSCSSTSSKRFLRSART